MLPAIFLLDSLLLSHWHTPSIQPPVQDSNYPANDYPGCHQNSPSLMIGHKPAINLTKTLNKWKRNTP